MAELLLPFMGDTCGKWELGRPCDVSRASPFTMASDLAFLVLSVNELQD